MHPTETPLHVLYLEAPISSSACLPLALALGCLGVALGGEGSDPHAAAPPDIPNDMRTYIVALLHRGPKCVAEDTTEVKALMARHQTIERRRAS